MPSRTLIITVIVMAVVLPSLAHLATNIYKTNFDDEAIARNLTLKQLPAIKAGSREYLMDPHLPTLREAIKDHNLRKNVTHIVFIDQYVPEDYSVLASLPNLEFARFYNVKGINGALTALLECRNLKVLDFETSDLNDESLDTISKMNQLKELVIFCNREDLSEEALDGLRAALPGCSVELP